MRVTPPDPEVLAYLESEEYLYSRKLAHTYSYIGPIFSFKEEGCCEEEARIQWEELGEEGSSFLCACMPSVPQQRHSSEPTAEEITQWVDGCSDALVDSQLIADCHDYYYARRIQIRDMLQEAGYDPAI